MSQVILEEKTSVRWTPDQERAIVSRRSNLLVSAAAGSGKTAVLVERILRLITEDRIPIQKMLIVTFTNAAAGEMRTRIIRELIKRMREDEADAQWLRSQLEKAGNASIMTLHAFCNDLVKKHFYKVDIDPAFRVGDTTLLKTLREEAVNETLEAAYTDLQADFVRFIEAFSGNRTDEKIEDMLWSVHNFIQSQPDPHAWLTVQTEALAAETAECSLWLKSLLSMIAEELEGLIESHVETKALCLAPGGPEAYLSSVQSDLEKLEALKTAIDNGYREAHKALAQFELARLTSIRGAAAEQVLPELREAVKERREMVKGYVGRLKKHFFSQSPEGLDASIRQLLPSTRALAELVIDLDLRYASLKRESNVLDFYDLEHLAIEILKDPEIAGMYREKYDHIFLDEYQDSNLVQETVIRAIAREDNVFLVGDVKQSIYKFRLADPTLFMEKLSRYSREPDARDRIIDLSANFRTRPELIERINGFFWRVMSPSLGEVTYDLHARLNPGLKFPPETGPSLSLTIVDTGSDGILDQEPSSEENEVFDPEMEEALSYMKNAELEAHVVAGMIRETLKTEIYDAKNNRVKMPSFKDVVILMRSPKSAAATYLDVLSQYGLPVRADGIGAKTASFEMQVALSLMKLIDNSRLDLDLLTVLRSPAGGFTTHDLVEVRRAVPTGSFRDAMDRLVEIEAAGALEDNGFELLKDLAIRVRFFLSRLDRWANFSNHERIGDFVWRLMIETGLLEYARAMPEGEIRESQLIHLVERAGNYEAMLRGDLAGFIKVLEEGEERDNASEIPKTLGEDEDFIRLMSIHKSKGLEFPIVFLSDTGKKFNMRDAYGDLLMHKDLGIALKEIDAERRTFRTSLPQLAIQKAIEREALSEELRILYVALTRAVDRLYVTGATKYADRALNHFSRGCLSFSMRQAKTPLDWMGAYAVGEEGGQGTKWSWQVVKAARLVREQTFGSSSHRQLETLLTEADVKSLSPEILIRLKGPAQTAQRLLPSKVSVTELKALESIDQNLLGRDATLEALYQPTLSEAPKFLGEENKATIGAARGSAFHTMLQNFDFETMGHVPPPQREMVFQSEKARMIREGRLDAALAQEIQWKNLESFFEHDLFRRMIKAKHIYREKAFVLRHGQGEDFTMIQGIMDLYFDSPEGLVLIDYKTDRIAGSDGIQQLKSRYSTQLLLYGEALSKLTGRPVASAWIYSSYQGQWVEIQLIPQLKEATF